MDQIRTVRVVAAFVIAPISYGLFLLPLLLTGGSFGEWIWLMMILSMFAYPITLIFGIPTYLVFRRYNIKSFGAYIQASVVFSAIPILLFVVLPTLGSSYRADFTLLNPTRFMQMATILSACVITGLVFWIIARPDQLKRRRPEAD